ncbi:MAG: hypothetical protein UW84_C0020G0024 [Candidatus Collierbacteria bacterium GW2011_GWA2_44_99]|uniref:Uncharacterized protein n=1 Tax=Candidatus Collierbacteria bacterium GW2011_GWA2_44_99 TaxID=1618380 RepID=A0A0G1KQP6_9BACT|nr:MAG: hypothetical protein UW84_C0020G0024 [Candidatus Collierbacteria bacterium GW2011_GWA2_44_99]KKU06749.1 MAG: hypothetical protein UX11_C0028G0002 [Candidatus Collierbacteria bacterium GW2011_GWC2_45_40]
MIANARLLRLEYETRNDGGDGSRIQVRDDTIIRVRLPRYARNDEYVSLELGWLQLLGVSEWCPEERR